MLENSVSAGYFFSRSSTELVFLKFYHLSDIFNITRYYIPNISRSNCGKVFLISSFDLSFTKFKESVWDLVTVLSGFTSGCLNNLTVCLFAHISPFWKLSFFVLFLSEKMKITVLAVKKNKMAIATDAKIFWNLLRIFLKNLNSINLMKKKKLTGSLILLLNQKYFWYFF